MEISFTTKEESKQRREEAFLKLKPVNPISQFSEFNGEGESISNKNKENKNKDNFVIIINQKLVD